MKKLFVFVIFVFLLVVLVTPVSASTIGDWFYVDLITGQHNYSGKVKVWDDGKSLYVKYITTQPWCLEETHLAVASSLEQIPQSNENPIPGQFPFSTTHHCSSAFTYTVPLDFDACTLYIAAHAVVYKEGDYETAWGDGFEFSGSNWATYFTYQTSVCHGTPSPTETQTATETPSPTSTETGTPTATETPSPTSTETGTPTSTATETPSPTSTATETPTQTPAPTISDIFPNSGPESGGTDVVITGTNLTDTISVTFGGTATTLPCVVDSDTQLTCTTPPHAAGTVDVSVTTTSGTTTFIDGYIYSPQSLPDGWEGSMVVEANRNILTVGRPYFGTQIASYDGYSAGSTMNYLPMLFKQAFGGTYNSEFYVQNISSTNTSSFTIQFHDVNGTLSCALNDTLPVYSSKSYSVSGLSCLPSGWVGGAVISSDYDLVAVGRPVIGTQQMTYNSFFNGSTTVHVPMLFSKSFSGDYISALYIQNLDPAFTATFSLKFYDTSGNLTCTMLNQQRAPLAARGYWLPTETCVPDGWVGGVLIESDYPLATVARSHVGAEITSYSGIIQIADSTYVPMLFKKAFDGSYLTALYIQNVDANNSAQITVDYYSSTGTLTCTTTETFSPMAAKGYWLPSNTCLPDGWVGSAVITSNTNVVAVARPHIGTEVTSYPGLPFGGLTAYLPMLYKNGGINMDYNSALYVQNLETSPADVNIKFFDTAGNLSCVINETFEASSVKGYWLPTLPSCP